MGVNVLFFLFSLFGIVVGEWRFSLRVFIYRSMVLSGVFSKY